MPTVISKSTLMSGAAKNDTLGADGDFTFSIADLLANDPGAAAKVSLATQFFFGSTLLDQANQTQYLIDHGITNNGDGTYTIKANATDFDYFVQIGNKGTWSEAHVDVTAPPPVSHIGASLFAEDFGHFVTDNVAAFPEDYPNGPPVAETDRLNQQIGTDPITQAPIYDPNGWFGLGLKGGVFAPLSQLVHDDTGVSSAPGTTDDYWLNFDPTSFDEKAIKKFAIGSLTHTFTDGNGGTDQVSFDLATFDFTRTNSTGQDVHYTTSPNDTFEFKIDGNVVFSTSAQAIHDAVGDNAMMHVNLLVNLGVGDHTLELLYTEAPEAPAPAPPADAPIERDIGIGIDSIHIHDWIVS